MTTSRESSANPGPGRDSPLGPDAWASLLGQALGGVVEVRFTRARRSVLRLEPKGRGRLVRMNAFFADAPLDVREAVIAWVRSGKRAKRKLARLDAWVEEQIGALEQRAPRRLRAVTRGRVHDLEALAHELRSGVFEGVFANGDDTGGLPWPKLTWGRTTRSRTRRSLRLGSFDAWTCVVRMHPVLDQPAVPASFVRYVLFHELLHAALPVQRSADGRRVFHGPEFRRREREFEGTRAALAWEKRHLAELLHSARTGRDMRPTAEVSMAPAARESTRAEVAPEAEPALPKRRGLRGLVQRWLFD